MSGIFDLWLNRRFMGGKTEKDYIEFVDPEAERICVYNFSSDGIGVTYADAARVTSLGSLFQNNQTIVTFNELQYFTSLTSLNYSGNTQYGTFYNCMSLTSVTLPPNVTTLFSTFNGCTSLQYVNLPTTITTLSGAVFQNCSQLRITVNLPNLTSISSNAFQGSSITSVTSLGSITTIPGGTGNNYGAFRYCYSLTSVTLPAGLTSLGANTFNGCTSLTTVTWPTGFVALGQGCFSACVALSSLSGLKISSLDSHSVFAGCSSLVSVNLSTSTFTSIPSNGGTNYSTGVFAGCTSLATMVLPTTLTSIGGAAFYQCTALSSINIPTTVTYIGNRAFMYDSSLTGTLTIPQAITVDAATFFETHYTKIVFGNNVAGLTGSINGWVSSLYSQTLLEVDFSANQTSAIGAYVFKNPSNEYPACPLTTIVCRATTPPSIETSTLSWATSLAHVYVPAASVDAYKAASGWSSAASIIEAIPS